MEYIKAFDIFICCLLLFITGSASTRRKICVPCTDALKIALCTPERTEVCIKDRQQLFDVLKKTECEITAQTQESKSDEVSMLSILYNPLFIVSVVTMNVILFLGIFCHRIRRLSSRRLVSTRNTTDQKVTLVKENDIRDDTGLRKTLFKKNIDATLSRIELEKLQKCMKSVGILFWNNIGQGTVVRIGSKCIITAWHVIEPIVLPTGRMDNYGVIKTSMNLESLKHKDRVCVDFSENTRISDPHCRIGLLPKICFLDKNLDVCILELDGDSRFLPEPINVYRDFYSMSRGTTSKFVHVIGQHPATSNIVVDTGCKIILPGDEKVKTAKKWIKKNKQTILRCGQKERDLKQSYDDVFETRRNLILDTYLDFGASGGAVISFTPQGDVALVAILLRGLPPWFWRTHGEEYGFPSSVLRMEVGCLITHILMSEEWTDAEKERIFGTSSFASNTDHTEIMMETDQLQRNAHEASGVWFLNFV